MYRVELKAEEAEETFRNFGRERFLMYRVELKDKAVITCAVAGWPVPNVPCGVERKKKRFGTAVWCMCS